MAHATVYADLTTSERLQYADWNSSYDTFQVSPDGVSLSPYELFNIAADQYTGSSSSTGQSVATFNNDADFYAERGVKSLVSDWTVSENSQIVGMYRSAGGFAHSLDFTNSTGTVWNTTAGQGVMFDSRETWIDSLDGSRNVNVGAIGTVNMTLTASWKANAANDDPVWLDVSNADKEYIRTRYAGSGDFSTTIYGDQPELNGGLISMVAYDVTDLIIAMGYSDIENAFMFTWEAWNWGTELGKANVNFDYNDMVFIMTNVAPDATPEPATMLIFGLGIAGVAAARRLRNRK